jgi:hypothetical protein
VDELDSSIEDKDRIKVLKLDVEGHELEVLEGAHELITAYTRDIIFEDHENYPSAVTQLLEKNNYTILRITKGILRPRLINPGLKNTSSDWEAPSYLATKDASRAIARMSKIGWQSLSAARSR